MHKKEIFVSHNRELQKRVGALLHEKPDMMVQTIAVTLGVCAMDAALALPSKMHTAIEGGEFIRVWETMCEWEKVTLLSFAAKGAAFEMSLRLPKGKVGGGMYNLMDKANPLRGHIFHEKIQKIILLSKPVFGKESHSAHFF